MARRADPPPLETNDVRAAVAGTIAWAVALVVLLIIGVPDRDRWWLWVCVAGIATGLFGIWYIPHLQRGRAAAAGRHPADDTEGRQATGRHIAEPAAAKLHTADRNPAGGQPADRNAAGSDAAERDAPGREADEHHPD